MPTNFTVNGNAASTDAPPATPLLWVIREGFKLTGTKKANPVAGQIALVLELIEASVRPILAKTK